MDQRCQVGDEARLASDTLSSSTDDGCHTALTRVTAPMPSLEKKKRNQCVTCLDMHKAPPGRIDDADLNGGCLIQRRSSRLIGWENRDREKNPPGGELRLRWEKVQNPLKTHTGLAAERDSQSERTKLEKAKRETTQHR